MYISGSEFGSQVFMKDNVNQSNDEEQESKAYHIKCSSWASYSRSESGSQSGIPWITVKEAKGAGMLNVAKWTNDHHFLPLPPIFRAFMSPTRAPSRNMCSYFALFFASLSPNLVKCIWVLGEISKKFLISSQWLQIWLRFIESFH